MNRQALPVWLLVGAVALGASLRLTDLQNRPIHADEAVQAFKFARLLEQGEYVYDPLEYHGPALSYLSLPAARLAGSGRLEDLTAGLLRGVPAVFGLALVGMLWLLRRDLGPWGAACAAALTALSPAMIFYSRYYIAETLLVVFTFGALTAFWRYGRDGDLTALLEPGRSGWARWFGRVGWLALGGLCLGLMHATKETCVIPMFAMLLAGICAVWPERASRQELRRGFGGLAAASLLVLLFGAGVSVLLFSSFLANPQGPVDSVRTYVTYLGRAAAAGEASRHLHPSYYYIKLLVWSPGSGAMVWTEGLVVLLAVAGLVGCLRGGANCRARTSLVRFLGTYTVVTALVYSLIPYKTPWCMLGFLHGMILLAGVGATFVVRALPGRLPKGAAVAVLLLGFAHLGWQGWRASFAAWQEPGNPYAYAQTTEAVPALADRIGGLSRVHPDGSSMPIQVICPHEDYWPLPWYFRRFDRVEWHEQVPDGPLAPVLVIRSDMESALARRLFAGGSSERHYLYADLLQGTGLPSVPVRPGLRLRAFARSDLWARYLSARTRYNRQTEEQEQ